MNLIEERFIFFELLSDLLNWISFNGGPKTESIEDVEKTFNCKVTDLQANPEDFEFKVGDYIQHYTDGNSYLITHITEDGVCYSDNLVFKH